LEIQKDLKKNRNISPKNKQMGLHNYNLTRSKIQERVANM